MNFKTLLIAVLAIVTLGNTSCVEDKEAKKPNIVVILVDDMG